MTERLGQVLYWAFCIVGAAFLLFNVWIGYMPGSDKLIFTSIGVIGFLIAFGLGRACRYVLAGN